VTLPTSTVFSAERRANVRKLLVDYHDSLGKRLLEQHRVMKTRERKNLRQFETKGDVFDGGLARRLQ